MENIHPMKSWRRANDRMTLAELAAKVGVTPSHLSEIENGKNEPSLELAVRLSRETGIEVAEFVRRHQKQGAA